MFTYRYPHPLPSPSSTYRHHRSLTFRDMVIIAEGTTDLNVLISVAHAASSRADSVLRRILERAGIPIPSSDTFKTSHTVRVELATKFARVAWSRRRTPLAEAWFDADADDRSHSLSLLSFPPWVLSRFHSYIDPPSPPSPPPPSASPTTVLVLDTLGVLTISDAEFYSRALSDTQLSLLASIIQGPDSWIAPSPSACVDVITHATRTPTRISRWVCGGEYSPSLPTPLLETMPDELLVYVFSFLSPRDYRALATTCRRMWRVGHDRLTLRKMLKSSERTPFPGHRNDPVALFIHYTSGASLSPDIGERCERILPLVARVGVETAVFLASEFGASSSETMLGLMPKFVIECAQKALITRVQEAAMTAQPLDLRTHLTQVISEMVELAGDVPNRQNAFEAGLGGALEGIFPLVAASRLDAMRIKAWLWHHEWTDGGAGGRASVGEFVGLLREREARLMLEKSHPVDRDLVRTLGMIRMEMRRTELLESFDPSPEKTRELEEAIGEMERAIGEARERAGRFLSKCPELAGASLSDLVYGNGVAQGLNRVERKVKNAVGAVIRDEMSKFKISVEECGVLTSLILRASKIRGMEGRILGGSRSPRTISSAMVKRLVTRVTALFPLWELVATVGNPGEVTGRCVDLIEQAGDRGVKTEAFLSGVQDVYEDVMERFGDVVGRVEALQEAIREVREMSVFGSSVMGSPALEGVAPVLRGLAQMWVEGRCESGVLGHLARLQGILANCDEINRSYVARTQMRRILRGYTRRVEGGVLMEGMAEEIVDHVMFHLWFDKGNRYMKDELREAVVRYGRKALEVYWREGVVAGDVLFVKGLAGMGRLRVDHGGFVRAVLATAEQAVEQAEEGALVASGARLFPQKHWAPYSTPAME